MPPMLGQSWDLPLHLQGRYRTFRKTLQSVSRGYVVRSCSSQPFSIVQREAEHRRRLLQSLQAASWSTHHSEMDHPRHSPRVSSRELSWSRFQPPLRSTAIPAESCAPVREPHRCWLREPARENAGADIPWSPWYMGRLPASLYGLLRRRPHQSSWAYQRRRKPVSRRQPNLTPVTVLRDNLGDCRSN